MNKTAFATLLAAALVLAGCEVPLFVLGFSTPEAKVAGTMPVELEYREAKGGLVLLRGRVNGKADVEFILDTGAPVSVLLDGPPTAALGLDSSKARRLGAADNPGAPIGDIQPGYTLAFGNLTLSGLTAVVIPMSTMPCREKFDEVGFGGVIGADLFKQFVVEIDTVRRRVRLHDPKGWKAAQGATALPITFRNGHPFVDARVTLADGQVIDGGMNVDTGMNRALTLAAGSHPALVMPANGVPRKSCYVSGVRDEREGPAVTLTLGGTRVDVARPIYSDFANAVDDKRTSTIGIGFFKDRRLFIDYPGRRLVLG